MPVHSDAHASARIGLELAYAGISANGDVHPFSRAAHRDAAGGISAGAGAAVQRTGDVDGGGAGVPAVLAPGPGSSTSTSRPRASVRVRRSLPAWSVTVIVGKLE